MVIETNCLKKEVMVRRMLYPDLKDELLKRMMEKLRKNVDMRYEIREGAERIEAMERYYSYVFITSN